MSVEVAHIELPIRELRVARTQPKCGFNVREAVFALANEHFPKAHQSLGVRVVTIVGDCRLGLGERWPHLPLGEENPPLRSMG